MSGLLALLDDVAAIAKLAAASLDDVAAGAARAGAKAAGVVIDDAAVTPRYVGGLPAVRELPIVWRIARGSLINKLAILLPGLLVLEALAPRAIPALLLLGGLYLCFEGAEKLWQAVAHGGHAAHGAEAGESPGAAMSDPVHLEETRVRGAIKTDFILSAEIMTIALAAIPATGLVQEAATLGLVAAGITLLVYGGVALIVKADDAGLAMARRGRLALTRALGRGLVRGMPRFMALLSAVGTAAMLWVGGSIVLHGLAELGLGGPAHLVHDLAAAAAAQAPAAAAALRWLATAALDALAGLAMGLALIPVAAFLIAPAARRLRRSA
jgi:predicted DNA repair protein MutK